MDDIPIESSFEQSINIGALAKALAAAQATITNPKADSANPFYDSHYADLASVIEAVREPLAANGIARVQAVLSRGPEVGVRTALVHASGEWIAATVWCKPEKSGPQALGSVITYLRRYSLAAAVGVAQQDDDAESAEKRAPKPGPRAVVTDIRQATVEASKLDRATQARIKILQGECGIPDIEWREKLQQYYKVDSSAKLTAEAAAELIVKLELRKSLRGTDTPGTSEAAKTAPKGTS